MRKALVIMLLVASCSTRDRSIPEGVLSRDRFREVLLEAQLVEARMNHELVIARYTRIPADRYYAQLFAEQGTTTEAFKASFRYWSGRPEDMKVIYEEIAAELSRRKDAGPQ